PGRRVRLRQEPIRDLHEVRIAVVRVAVREGELDRLDESMQVCGRIMAEGLQVDAVQEIEHLEQRRALTPEPTGSDFVADEGRMKRASDLDAELGEVAGRERSTPGAVA